MSAQVDTHPLVGGGEMGALMRSVDWAATPLGPVESWPQSLRTSLSILLATGFPMYIAWGPSFIQFYNDGYRPILGSTKHPAAMGISTRQTFAEIWHIIGPMFEDVMRGKTVSVVDFLLPLDRHGFVEECYFTFSYSPIRQESGQVGGVLVTVTETSERVIGGRRMQLLHELSTQTQGASHADLACQTAAQVIGNSPADIPFARLYLLSRDGGQARLVGTAGTLGATDAEPEAELIELPAPPTSPVARWPLAEVAQSGVPQLIELEGSAARSATPAHRALPRRALVLPISRPGEPKPVGILVAGISERLLFDAKYRSFLELVAGQVATAIASARALEEAKERAAALAEIDRAKTAFFSNVSHEFRTPLTLLLGPAQDALANAQALSAEDVQRWQLVNRNGLRLLKLVNTLLDFARIEAGRVQASYQPTDLGLLTRDLASLFLSAIERAGLRLHLDIELLDEQVYVDHEMWEKIVLNLLSNALKFTLKGEIRVGLRRNSGHVELRVSDTGIGVPPEELPLLFDRFHRVKSSHARTHEGTGIGLALVQELVKLHGGSIAVTSAVGQGTSFTVKIPLGSVHLPKAQIAVPWSRTSTVLGAAPFVEEALSWTPAGRTEAPRPVLSAPVPVMPASHQPSGPRPTKPRRILLADDNKDMREYLTRLLRERWTVEAVSDGVTALEQARKNRPDLILTDVMMPGMDGFQLLRELRSDARTRAIPVIFLSARAGEESRLDGLQVGADDYLVKPFSARELMARVNTHLEFSRLRVEAERAREETAALLVRLQAALGEAERQRQRLEALFRQAPAPLALLRGPDHIYELANAPYLRMVKRGPNLIGKNLRDGFPELAGQGTYEIFDRVYQTGEGFLTYESPMQINRGDGTLDLCYFAFSLEAFRDANDQVQGLMLFAVDVTEQVRAREAVQEAQATLRLALESGDIGIWDFYPQTGIMRWDQWGKALLGLPPDAEIGYETFLAGLHPQDREAIDRQVQQALDPAGDRVFSAEYRTIGPTDRMERWLQAQGRAFFDESGKPVRFVGAVKDVTRQKRAEAEREALITQLAKANSELDQFAYSASHDLRAPLRGIANLSNWIEEELGDRMTDEARSQMNMLRGRVYRLDQLIEGILTHSRAARIRDKTVRIDVGVLVRDVIELLAPPKTATFEIDPLPSLLTERAPMQQVFLNLIGNAVKYARRPDVRIHISARSLGAQWEFSVADNGPGIAPEFHARIWNLFETLESRDKFEGSGVGLAVVKKIVEARGGQAWVESEAGQGATFRFTWS